MDRRVPLPALSLLAALLAAPGGAADLPASSVLVSYSFEDQVDTGPDTFAVFQHSKGTVRLSDAYRVSGYRSVEIRDVAGDGDFPELQGYFAQRRSGRVFAHFAFLTAEPEQAWNAALAGPAWFRLGKDGIAFWLFAEEGVLRHNSDGIPKRLFRLQPFVWYLVDVAYDVGAGTYDLTIREEGRGEPLVALRHQPNAGNAPASAVDKFSFIGDLEDRSKVTWFVDDVVVGVDERVNQLPFVAPGRRKLFVDGFREHQRQQREKPSCLPAAPPDLGLLAEDLAWLKRSGSLGAWLSGAAPKEGTPLATATRLQAVRDWREGCALLARGEAAKALTLFDQADRATRGRAYGLSAALALAHGRRGREAAERLGDVAGHWGDDPRYAVTAAQVGLARGDLGEAEGWLRAPAEGGPRLPTQVEQLASELYYHVLLWQDRFEPARDYALRVADRMEELGRPSAAWIENAADAAFLAGGLAEARGLYEESLGQKGTASSVLLKLSDVAFLEGDLEQERALRERIYGSLR